MRAEAILEGGRPLKGDIDVARERLTLAVCGYRRFGRPFPEVISGSSSSPWKEPYTRLWREA